MVKRWILYLAILLGLIIFYVAYQGMVAWVLLVTAACLPWFSLLASVPFMLALKPSVTCSGLLTVGDAESLFVTIQSRLPLPPSRCVFQVKHSLTQTEYRLKPDAPLPTEHCGMLECQCTSYYVYDFLGLFRLGLHRLPQKRILIRPKPIECNLSSTLDRHIAQAWKPKYGGGFAENHDLRLYRPGDGLNQLHWKLSAKTGKLIVREPMVPRTGRLLLTLDLYGTPGEMDRKLGQLLWMGNHLLERGLSFELHALTGEGTLTFSITGEIEFTNAVDALLSSSPASTGSLRHEAVSAAWRCHIGGDRNET